MVEKFFKKSFLLANVKPNVVLKIFFLTMSNVEVDFQAWDLQWRFYITKNILPTIRQVELIEKKEFTVAVLDSENEAFVIYVATLSINLSDDIHPSKKASIAHLKADKAPTKVSSKYTDFADVFSPKLALNLPKNIKNNDRAIELVDN